MLPGPEGRTGKPSTGEGRPSYRHTGPTSRSVRGSRIRHTGPPDTRTGNGPGTGDVRLLGPITETRSTETSQRSEHAGHGHRHDVQHHLVRLLQPAEEAAGPRGH